MKKEIKTLQEIPFVYAGDQLGISWLTLLFLHISI